MNKDYGNFAGSFKVAGFYGDGCLAFGNASYFTVFINGCNAFIGRGPTHIIGRIFVAGCGKSFFIAFYDGCFGFNGKNGGGDSGSKFNYPISVLTEFIKVSFAVFDFNLIGV